MSDNVFGSRLRLLLEESNIDGKAFAKLLHVQPPTLSNWLNGNRFPKDIETLINIANYFDVSLDYLLGKSDIRNLESIKSSKPITDVEKAIKIVLDQPDLMLKGNLLSDESRIILQNSILNGVKLAVEIEKYKENNLNKK